MTHLGSRYAHEFPNGRPPDAPPPGVAPAPVQPPPTPIVPPAGGGLAAGRLVRVTNEDDGQILNRIYSYGDWSNAVVLGDAIYAFVGHADGRPRFFRVTPATGEIERLGSLLGYGGTGEGWGWTAAGDIRLCDGPRLRLVNPLTGRDDVVLDISAGHPGCRLWQAHSSDDLQTFSATVERIVAEGPYPRLGTFVSYRGEQRFYPPVLGALDESQVTPDGRFLIIKEGPSRQVTHNRVITLATREERQIFDHERALGHSDCGVGFLIGEADKPDPGMCGIWEIGHPLTIDRFIPVFPTLNMGHISVRGRVGLHSDHTWLNRIDIDARRRTPLLAHGMMGSGYEFEVHANLSPCGRIGAYVSNVAGRFDLYLLGVS
jgi:hypothetical protein